MDISESGKQIAEKLRLLLDNRQRRELAQYILSEASNDNPSISWPPMLHNCSADRNSEKQPLTEIYLGDLYYCLENRIVQIAGTDIELTATEFDIFSLLVENPNRVFSYEAIMDIVWQEGLDCNSRKAVNNHISNLRKKLKVTTQTPAYIKSVRGVGYKFSPGIR